MPIGHPPKRVISRKQFNAIVGKNLRRIRTAKQVTQEKLSHDCGFYRTYITLIESHKTSPSAYTLYKIAIMLGTTIESLFPNIKLPPKADKPKNP